MLFSVEQPFVGRDEKQAPLKTPAWEATSRANVKFCVKFFLSKIKCYMKQAISE